uniref:Uncharacterized protein n=1 Tax=Cyanothece sp. (strain PCC 7425 / ATCC 29141) TaxID=395961 RepID=B8HQ13_CYAP4
MKPDFNAMSKSELRAYVVNHPKDQAAFYAFVDRFTAEASPTTFPIPQSQAETDGVDRMIQQTVQELKSNP